MRRQQLARSFTASCAFIRRVRRKANGHRYTQPNSSVTRCNVQQDPRCDVRVGVHALPLKTIFYAPYGIIHENGNMLTSDAYTDV